MTRTTKLSVPHMVFYKSTYRILRHSKIPIRRTVMPPPGPINAAFVRASDLLGRFAVRARAQRDS